MSDSMLQFLDDYDQGDTEEQTTYETVEPVQEQQDVQSENMLNFLDKFDNTDTLRKEVSELPLVPVAEEPEVAAPEDDPKYVEYYAKRMIPTPDHAVAYSPLETTDLTRLEKAREEFSFVEELTEEELEVFGDEMSTALREGNAMREAGPIEYALSYLPPKTLLKVGEGVTKASAFTVDGIESGLVSIQENAPIVYDAINAVVAGGRYAKAKDAGELANTIAGTFGTFTEFAETIPALGGIVTSYRTITNTAAKTSRGMERGAAKAKKELERAQRYNPGGAQLATLERSEEARQAAQTAAEANRDISNQLIREFEEKTGKVISKEVDGNLTIDPSAARQAGVETAKEITERDGALFDLAIGDDVITSPLLQPDKFDGIVASAAELKDKFPDAFDNKKTVIDNLFELTVNKDLIQGQELVDTLNKFGVSFEDYVLTVVGSGSEAGKILNKLSQIKRVKPKSIADADEAARAAREAGDFRKFVMRTENIRRGGLVSQVATAARNLTSGVIRAPMESLGNVMDNALHAASNKGVVAAGQEVFSRDNWRGSFSNMKYIFSRPDVAQGYSDLILKSPQMSKQFDAMYNNINEIQALTGRGTGSKLDKVMSGMEDVVDTLNGPNRWQEYLIRRGSFFGELERLTKREYGIDLIDTLNEGKLKDLLNDASSVRTEGSPSFIALVDDAVTKALDVTYAKQPEIPVFRSTSQFIVRNGLTTVIPFPRFMFNSMELMGQYAAGASIPLTRKVASIVSMGKVGKGALTAKDRQRITRNLMGMAAVGSAYWYRSSEKAPAEYNQVAVGHDAQMDTTPTYPMAHFLYLGEATKRMINGTFDDWFDTQEFVELFTGSNFRTGVGNSVLEEVAQMADATDLTKGEAAGRLLGRTFGNYLSTWAVPFGQVIDAERALGVRGTEYKDISSDPTLSFENTLGKELLRPLKQRGIGVTPEEEEEAPRAEYPFYDEGKERLAPSAKFIGATITNRPSEAGEYLMRLGFDWRDVGSKSKVPSIKRFETQMVNGFMPTVVDIAQTMEEDFRSAYVGASAAIKKEFTEEEYVTNKIRPFIKEQLTSFKNKIREGAIAQGDEYARALTTYRRVQPDFRKLATTDFIERYNYKPDPLNAEDLNKLVIIAKAYKEGY